MDPLRQPVTDLTELAGRDPAPQRAAPSRLPVVFGENMRRIFDDALAKIKGQGGIVGELTDLSGRTTEHVGGALATGGFLMAMQYPLPSTSTIFPDDHID